MFRTTIETEVVLPITDKGGVLTISLEDDVLRFHLEYEQELVFSGDWTGNFLPLFRQVIDMWSCFALEDED